MLVARRGVPAPTAPCLEARAELSRGHQQVDVVGADKVLRQVDDGGRQRRLAVVVGGVLRHVAGQLGHLRDAPGGRHGKNARLAPVSPEACG